MALPALVTTVGTAALERAAEAFGSKVLTRWSDYRARRFIEAFVAEVAAGAATEAEADDRLNRVVDDENKSAALFDAFRHVFLSASREIGPRVLALHMAEVVAGLVDEPEISDGVMAASAALLDVEFEDFVSFAASHGLEDASFADSLQQTGVITIDTVDFDSNWRRGRATTGPLALRVEVGSWAQKLQLFGLVAQDISEEEFDYREDDDRHIDEPGTVRRVHRNIELREGCSHLVRLTRRAMRARQSA